MGLSMHRKFVFPDKIQPSGLERYAKKVHQKNSSGNFGKEREIFMGGVGSLEKCPAVGGK